MKHSCTSCFVGSGGKHGARGGDVIILPSSTIPPMSRRAPFQTAREHGKKCLRCGRGANESCEKPRAKECKSTSKGWDAESRVEQGTESDTPQRIGAFSKATIEKASPDPSMLQSFASKSSKASLEYMANYRLHMHKTKFRTEDPATQTSAESFTLQKISPGRCDGRMGANGARSRTRTPTPAAPRAPAAGTTR